MIEKLQGDANRAVAVMQSSCNKAQEGKQKVATAGHALDQISNAVATINDMNAMIASAAEEQSSVAEEINRNVTSVSQIAEETSEASRENVATSTQLASLASQLQRLAQMFRIQGCEQATDPKTPPRLIIEAQQIAMMSLQARHLKPRWWMTFPTLIEKAAVPDANYMRLAQVGIAFRQRLLLAGQRPLLWLAMLALPHVEDLP